MLLSRIWYSRLPIGRILQGLFSWPQEVGLGHHKDVPVPGLSGGGEGEPGAELVPPGVESLEPKLGQLVGQGGRLEAHHGSHGHPLALLQGLLLHQGQT